MIDPNDMGTKIEIRQAAAGDVRLLSVLASTTFYEAYFEQDDPHNLSDYISESFNIKNLSNELTGQELTFFIAFISGAAVGYAKLDAASRDPSIITRRTIELKRLYTLERIWGKGVGEALLRHCEQFAIETGCESIWLGVWQQNERGQRFYRKQGFEKRGTLEFPYGEAVGINDVMEKTLKH
jgi:ribosomal protein S18 acetylase RimI-like enzyme